MAERIKEFVRGEFPHSFAAVERLAAQVNFFVRESSESGVPVCVVCTGDVTRSQSAQEFGVGQSYLRSAIYLSPDEVIGLVLGSRPASGQIRPGEAALFVVPGNHDTCSYFSGLRARKYHAHFPGPYPIELEILDSTGHPRVCLWGVNSAQTDRRHHLDSQGWVPPTQLKELYARLRNRMGQKAIKVVCLHHPLSAGRQQVGKNSVEDDPRRLPLDGGQEIASKLSHLGTDLVLAGHVHEFFVQRRTQGMPNQIVAGTATQLL